MADGRKDLVEPEGVNAGSTKDLMDGADRDARPGGDPARSGQADSASGPAVVQPPWDHHDEDAPSLDQSREEGAR